MGTESQDNLEPGFDMHVFICGHSRPENASRPNCCSRNSLSLLTELKKKVRDTGVKGVRVQKSGCLDYCENGISCVIYPMSEWYSLEGEKDLEILFERIVNGTPAQEIKMKIDG
jgi:(2Fe-2S) ferredoxin|tara:strand:+ start:31 stop:372 length:342 start_codon:yes stop_codon:yes gene_type:complete